MWKKSVLALAILGWSAASVAVEPEYGGHCTMGAAAGAKLPTTCAEVWISPEGKLYCFSSAAAKREFLKAPQDNLQKAQAFWNDPAFWERVIRQ